MLQPTALAHYHGVIDLDAYFVYDLRVCNFSCVMALAFQVQSNFQIRLLIVRTRKAKAS